MRDPKLEPKPGDRFSDTIFFLKITRAENRKVWYELRGPGSHPIYNIPMQCAVGIAVWRKRSVDYEVLHTE